MQEARKPGRKGRWFRRALVLLGLAVAAAGLWDVVTYDRDAWLSDYARLKHDLAHGYANLDWIRDHRGVDLAELDRQTTRALATAHSRLRASLALRAFLRRFDDPHLRLEPRRQPSPPATGSTSQVPPAAAAPATVADCPSAGYEEGDHAFAFPFAEMPGWRQLRGGDFPLGRLGDIGVVRIAQFSERRYLAACQRVFRPGMDTYALQLAMRAEQQRLLVDSLETLGRDGATRLLVDVTGNGGGSEWVAEVVALVTARMLTRAASRRVGPACDRDAVWRNEPVCPVLAPAGADERLQGIGAWRGPVLVLAARGTASAAEDFVAWLQQNRVATVVGERTHGAGCGYTSEATRTRLDVLSLEVAMPDCARFLADGTNELEGIAPDVALDTRAADAPAPLLAVLDTLQR